MADTAPEKIKNSIEAASGLYHRLVLVVGQSGRCKTDLLRQVAKSCDSAVTNVSLELSRELLELSSRQRILKLPEIFDLIVQESAHPVILDNLEILFDQTLQQDPLRLLCGLSRNRVVVAAWNGLVAGSKLIYAETGHPEYRTYDVTDILIVNLAEAVLPDSASPKAE